jgi:hypothetical protein
MTFIEAVNLALRTELETDPATLVYGEDVGASGGIFGASRYLQRDFGEDRVFDMPIAENAILGSAVGAAIGGMKPIVEIMWADFIFVALDQVVNQAANVRYVTGGRTACPMVIRTQQGVTPGSCAQHSQSIEAVLAHVPGVKVALAASATDAYALLRAAAADPDPVVVIEARGLYQEKAEVHLTEGAEPVGKARLRRAGSDVAFVTAGAGRRRDARGRGDRGACARPALAEPARRGGPVGGGRGHRRKGRHRARGRAHRWLRRRDRPAPARTDGNGRRPDRQARDDPGCAVAVERRPSGKPRAAGRRSRRGGAPDVEGVRVRFRNRPQSGSPARSDAPPGRDATKGFPLRRMRRCLFRREDD